VLINELVCEGCGDCGVQSNCLSVHPVETELVRKTQIHQPSCNKDYSCLKGNCPSFLTITPGTQKPASVTVEPLQSEALPEPTVAVPSEEYGLRITGIGGTGVVTVAQTLAVAALLDGLFVRGLDQTGLAQKGGPVVSDLKMTTAPIDQANKLASADCDLYLACDLLVGAQQHNLKVTDPERTIAVVSTAQVPTGHMVVDTRTTFPDSDKLLARIMGSSRDGLSTSLDSQSVSERLFGSDQVANILLVGAAYQAGALPLTAESIERAIELNGVAVEMNKQAFRRGRQSVADPAGLTRALATASGDATVEVPLSPEAQDVAGLVQAEPGSELERLVGIRVPLVMAYQNRAYAERYARRVEKVRQAEAERVPGRSDLAETVAFNLHKLMTYKDEYEVARLHLDPNLRQDIETRFGADASYSFMLHPPALKTLGMERKIKVPGKVGIAMFKALAPMKRLRHTRFDPFGRDHVRAVERELIREYEALIDEITDRLSPENHGVAVDLAGLPDMVRGYDEVKLRNVDLYHEQIDRLRPQLTDGRRTTEMLDVSR
jgi:indolepyruvate ferredoxin oxidoreductase